MTAAQSPGHLKYRTIWLSDIHLGYRDCKAEYLLDFLARVECQTLYLLGDIVDLWALQRHLYWPADHYDVIRAIVRKAQTGTRVIYIPGNHDEAMRDYVGQQFGPVEIRREAVHRTADGRRLLLFHGDCLDTHIQLGPIARTLGPAGYDLLLFLNRWTNRVRRRCGRGYWSLAAYLKNRVGSARAAIELFERAALHEARRRGLDGVVCGHIHQAEMRIEGGLLYCNDGDWVESCTALVEDLNGHLEIVHWSEVRQSLKRWCGSGAEVTADISMLAV